MSSHVDCIGAIAPQMDAIQLIRDMKEMIEQALGTNTISKKLDHRVINKIESPKIWGYHEVSEKIEEIKRAKAEHFQKQRERIELHKHSIQTQTLNFEQNNLPDDDNSVPELYEKSERILKCETVQYDETLDESYFNNSSVDELSIDESSIDEYTRSSSETSLAEMPEEDCKFEPNGFSKASSNLLYSVVMIEFGSSMMRTGLIDICSNYNSSCDDVLYDEFPSCIAKEKLPKSNSDDIVKSASGMSSSMFANFRETGIFLGHDALFCCMSHPDFALRGKLKLEYPLERGIIAPSNHENVIRLLNMAFARINRDPNICETEVHALFAFKPYWSHKQIVTFSKLIFDNFEISSLRVVNEPMLVALAENILDGLVICIGEDMTSVSPIYQSALVWEAVHFMEIGGIDIDRYMDHMLLSRTNEVYNTMVDRKRLTCAREIKEKTCYVAENFVTTSQKEGIFQQKSLKVFKDVANSPKMSKYKEMSVLCSDSDDDRDDPEIFNIKHKDGSEAALKVGRERFHGPEILFRPSLIPEKMDCDGLGTLILKSVMKCEPELRKTMLENIIVHGRSAQLEGLSVRIERELLELLPAHLVDFPSVKIVEDSDLGSDSDAPTPVLKGAEIFCGKEIAAETIWIDRAHYLENPSKALVPSRLYSE